MVSLMVYIYKRTRSHSPEEAFSTLGARSFGPHECIYLVLAGGSSAIYLPPSVCIKAVQRNEANSHKTW